MRKTRKSSTNQGGTPTSPHPGRCSTELKLPGPKQACGAGLTSFNQLILINQIKLLVHKHGLNVWTKPGCAYAGSLSLEHFSQRKRVWVVGSFLNFPKTSPYKRKFHGLQCSHTHFSLNNKLKQSRNTQMDKLHMPWRKGFNISIPCHRLIPLRKQRNLHEKTSDTFLLEMGTWNRENKL